jgi:anti-anti-sigma regulatory factor
MCCLTGVCNVKYPQQADPGLWAEIVTVSADGVVLGLSGEVDISNQIELDVALMAMMATKADHALIDASDCSFISLQGYVAIGRCSSELDSLTLRTRLGVARRALRLLGFDGVVCVPARAPICLTSESALTEPEMQTGAMCYSLCARGVG